MIKEALLDKIADSAVRLFIIRAIAFLLAITGVGFVGGLIYLIIAIVSWPFVTLANMIIGG